MGNQYILNIRFIWNQNRFQKKKSVCRLSKPYWYLNFKSSYVCHVEHLHTVDRLLTIIMDAFTVPWGREINKWCPSLALVPRVLKHVEIWGNFGSACLGMRPILAWHCYALMVGVLQRLWKHSCPSRSQITW